MKKTISLLLAFTLSLALAVPALAYDEATATQRANELYMAGLFNGYGNDANGNPIFGLNDTATRAQGITMFVRVLGKGDEAQQNAAAYDLPFTDLPDWCRGYVGYAYANKYTSGTSSTTFSPNDTLTANQFMTFCLRSLGYVEGKDFYYTDPTGLAAKLGIIRQGEWQNNTTPFKRGDMVLMAYNTLYVAPSVMETLPADNIDKPTKPTEPEKPSKPSSNTTLLPEKVGTTDFDADNNRTLYDPDSGTNVADIEYSKGMIVNSERIKRSSSGKEAIREYIGDMEDIFGELDTSWNSDSYVKLAGKSTSISVDSSGKYNVYTKKLNKNTSGTNLWLNFIAYVTNKDVAKAVYGICVEKITLGDLNPMSAELVAKYGGTLVSDVQTDEITHVASISVGGYDLKIKYTACNSDIIDDSVRDFIASYSIVI